jgi:hypothetical protein
MIFTPSSDVYARIVSDAGGVWVDRSQNEPHLWLVARLPMHLIREIDVGVPVDLRVWVVESDGQLFTVFGFIVHEGKTSSVASYGGCRSTDEIEGLRDLLMAGSFPLQVHNENTLPILHAKCRIDSSAAAHVLAAIPTGTYPEGDGYMIRSLANDIVEASLESETPDPRIKAAATLPITFEEKVKIDVQVIGSGQICLTNATTNDQGDELERLTFQQLETLFPFGTFHSPERDHTKGRLELCDVLALSRIREMDEEGIFVIQNKVIPADGTRRTAVRQALTIQKNALEALGQLVGAITKLKAGVQVYRNGGGPIEEDLPEVAAVAEPLNLKERANQLGQGIVVISDMHEGVDWKEVWNELLEACRKTRYFFHVLDLRELQRLILHSNGRPALFEGLLVTRWGLMAKSKSAAVRIEFQV